MKNNLIRGFAVLFTVFCIYGTANAEQTIPAKIDTSKLTTKTANEAISQCGFNLVRQLRQFPVCKTPTYGCVGSLESKNQTVYKKELNDTTQLNMTFGMYNKYADYHYYNGKSFSTDFFAFVMDPKSNGALSLIFTDNSRDEAAGKEFHQRVPLITDAELPQLRFSRKEIKHCTHDQWGAEHCESSTYEYSRPQWVWMNKMATAANWKNSDTNVVLNKTADFAKYMSCVEQNIR